MQASIRGMDNSPETILEEDEYTIGKPYGSNHSPHVQVSEQLFECYSGLVP